MGKRQPKSKSGARRRRTEPPSIVRSRVAAADDSGAAVTAGDHDEDHEPLTGGDDHVFGFMRRRVVELEQQIQALQAELRAAHEREDEGKVRALEGRRAERRYQQLLIGLAEVADDYRLSVEQTAEHNTSPLDEEITAEQFAQRMRRMVLAPLERIQDLLAAEGVVVQHAELECEIDVRRFEVAATVEDAARVPGTVVRAHRPAYVGQNGAVIRRGAAVVARRGDAISDDAISDDPPRNEA